MLRFVSLVIGEQISRCPEPPLRLVLVSCLQGGVAYSLPKPPVESRTRFASMKLRSVVCEGRVKRPVTFLANRKKKGLLRVPPASPAMLLVKVMRNTTIHYQHLGSVVNSIDAQTLRTRPRRIHSRKSPRTPTTPNTKRGCKRSTLKWHASAQQQRRDGGGTALQAYIVSHSATMPDPRGVRPGAEAVIIET